MKPRQPAHKVQGAKSGGDGCCTRTQDEDAAVSIRRFARRIFLRFLLYDERKVTYGKTFLHLGVCHRGTSR